MRGVGALDPLLSSLFQGVGWAPPLEVGGQPHMEGRPQLHSPLEVAGSV